MRGAGNTLSRLPAVLRLVASVVILSGAIAPAVRAEAPGSGNGLGSTTSRDERPAEVAYAVPRLRLNGAEDDVRLPHPLSPRDATLARRIFTLQAQGAIAAADRALAEMESPLLMGHILAQRYLGAHHRSSAAELRDWLALYADLPQAPAIHALLLRRLPAGMPPPPAPPAATPPAVSAVATDDLSAPRLPQASSLLRVVTQEARDGRLATALSIIARARAEAGTAEMLRGEVAREMFLLNRDADALAVAREAVAMVPAAKQTGTAAYVGGLAAWRMNRAWLARTLFIAATEADAADLGLVSAAALWAARASYRMHDPQAARHWLFRAAAGPASLHGLIARRMLGQRATFGDAGTLLTTADVEAVGDTVAGLRGFALLQTGQPDMAEGEFRALWARRADDTAMARSLSLVAGTVGLVELAAQVSDSLSDDDDAPAEPRLAVPRLRPAGGFRVDPSLVYALTRLESNFDSSAVSSAGARGLMQLMPVTARYIGGERLDDPDQLHNPAVNLDVGQRYVAYLARQGGIGDNLLHVLASYNSGPGSFLRWAGKVRDEGDPLLFLEAIPVAETRGFVTRALTYSWLYAARLRLPAASLDALARGHYPRFTPASSERKMADAPQG